MMQENYEIIFYDLANGERPAYDFIKGLDKKMQAKVVRLIDMLEVNGPALREPYSKALEDGIFELRAQAGSDISRVLYFFIVGKKVVLTNGFIKKTMKTPAAEKKRAKAYRDEYMSRKGNQ